MVRARLYVLFAAVCFGTTGTAQALGPEAAPVTVGAVRIVLGAALLWAAQRLLRAPCHTIDARSARWPVGPQLIGAIGVAGYALSFFGAVKATGVAVGTVVALGSAPAFTGLGAWLLHRIKPPGVWFAATGLATTGVALIGLAGGGAEVSAFGVLLALCAGASYAAYTLAAKRMLDAQHPAEQVMARIFGFGALLLSPVLLFGDLSWLGTVEGVGMALWLAAVPTALAYLLFASGLRHLAAGDVATLTLAEPVTAIVLSALVLGERPGAVAVVGCGLVLCALTLLAVPQRSARVPA